MLDFSPKVEFLLCYQSNQLNDLKKYMKNMYFLLLQQVGMLFLHTSSRKKKKISKLSMIIGFGEECFKTTISEVG